MVHCIHLDTWSTDDDYQNLAYLQCLLATSKWASTIVLFPKPRDLDIVLFGSSRMDICCAD